MRKMFCNLCGKEYGDINQDYNDEFSIHTMIGYGSKYDMHILKLDLCSSCMDKLIDQCVIPPVTDIYEMADSQEYKPHERYDEESMYWIKETEE